MCYGRLVAATHAAELALRDPMDHPPDGRPLRAGEVLTVKSQVGLAWSAVIAAVVVSGCQSVRDGPANPKAVRGM